MQSDANSPDGFLDLREIADLESHVTTRTVRNRIKAGTFPQADAIRDGQMLWLVSTYKKYQAAVLAGDYRGRDRMAHLPLRGAAASKPAAP
jgi:hypothetical protein